MKRKSGVGEVSIFILVIIYLFKVNEIAVNYKKHSKEVREKDGRRERELNILKDNSTKEFNNIKKELKFNRCVTEKVPKITGMLETVQLLRYSYSSLIRFGDSEIDIMRMMDDFRQGYNATLCEKLLEAFFNNNPDVMIGLPNVFDGYPKLEKGIIQFWTKDYKGVKWLKENVNYSKQYFDTFITSPYISTYGTSCELVNLIYDNMKEIFRDKDLVILRGNNSEVYDYDVFEYAKSQKILYAPPKNAWEKYDELRKMLFEEDEEALYIISIGITSEVLVMDLVNDGRRAMDLGHLAKDYDCYMKQIYDKRFFR